MQTSKQYHSLALWVIMLISLSLLSACGGSSSGDSNSGAQTLFGFGDELPEDTAIPINNKFLTPDSGVTLLNTENPPTEWKKGVDFHITQRTWTSSANPAIPSTPIDRQRTLTIAGLYQTDNDKYSGAKVTENGQETGLGLIRNSGEALFFLDIIDDINADQDYLILGNAIVLDPLDLDNYVGDYGCGVKDCKDAIALGNQYLYNDNAATVKKFYHDDVKININVKNEGNKLIASVPAWFVSDRLNSEEFTVLNGISDEFSNNVGVGGSFYINYYGDPNPDNDVYVDYISITGRLFTGSTDDLFIAGDYNFEYSDRVRKEIFDYYGVFALEKN